MRTPITKYLWALTLLTVPVTSFPWLPLGATVSPLSLVFMLPTLVLGLTNAHRLHCLVTSPIRILGLFAIWAIATTGWQVGEAHGAAGNSNVNAAAFSEMVTLFIGVGFYATAILMITNSRELAFTLRWLMAGLGVSVAVALMQGVALLAVPSLYSHFDDFFATYIAIDKGARDGARGFTLEPSWLASQLTVLGLPIILARSFDSDGIRRWRIQGRRWNFLVQPNWLVLALFMAAITLSLSRGGLVASVLMLVAACAFWFAKARSVKDLLTPIVVLLTVALMVSVAYLSSSYVRVAFDFPDSWQSMFAYVRAAGASSRVTLWLTWWNTFLESPIMGVGLGQSPFYFYSNVPFWAVREWEVFQYMIGVLPDMPNAKNLFIRVLAETGIVGVVLFFAFVVKHFVCALASRRSEVTVFAVVLAIAMIVDFMSLDTFALPTWWLALALLWTMSRFRRRERRLNSRSRNALRKSEIKNARVRVADISAHYDARRSFEA